MWVEILARWKQALLTKNIESFFINSYENRNEMRTTYSRLNDIAKFTEWLEMKADQETSSIAPGQIPFSIGGY